MRSVCIRLGFAVRVSAPFGIDFGVVEAFRWLFARRRGNDVPGEEYHGSYLRHIY